MPFSEEQRTLAAVDVAVAARADTHELQRHGEQRKHKDKEHPFAVRVLHRGDEIVGAVQQRGHQDRHRAAALGVHEVAVVVIALGAAVVDAHEHAEAGVAGDCGHGAHERGAQAVHGDVAEIFPQGEAERDEHGVHHAVELAIEGVRAPCPAAEQDILCALLGKGDDDKVHDDVVGQGVFRIDAPEQGRAELLEHHRDDRGEHAAQDQREQQPRRLRLQTVGAIDPDEQKDRRHDRRGDQNGIHVKKKHTAPLEH